MEILKKSLDLASNASPTIPPNVTALKLNESISAIYNLLKRYRDLEAREVLCEELRRQVVMSNVAPGRFNRMMSLPITDSFHGIFIRISIWMRTQGSGCILPQYVHGSVPGSGELTEVVLYVVVFESRGACERCEDFLLL